MGAPCSLWFGLEDRLLEACFCGLVSWIRRGTCSLLKFIETRESRARDLHPHDRKSPDPLSVTKPLFFDLRYILRRSHSKGMDIETIVDLEYIWILSIASFLIEIIAKYPQKVGDKKCKRPNLGWLGLAIDKIQRDSQSRNDAPSPDKKIPF